MHRCLHTPDDYVWLMIRIYLTFEWTRATAYPSTIINISVRLTSRLRRSQQGEAEVKPRIQAARARVMGKVLAEDVEGAIRNECISDWKQERFECLWVKIDQLGNHVHSVHSGNYMWLVSEEQGFSTWGTRTPGGTWDLFRGYENIIAEFASFCWKR